jgi:hypothetical protein
MPATLRARGEVHLRIDPRPQDSLGLIDPRMAIQSETWRKSANLAQPDPAVDDELSAGNIAGILREQESGCPGHFVGCTNPL